MRRALARQVGIGCAMKRAVYSYALLEKGAGDVLCNLAPRYKFGDAAALVLGPDNKGLSVRTKMDLAGDQLGRVSKPT